MPKEFVIEGLNEYGEPITEVFYLDGLNHVVSKNKFNYCKFKSSSGADTACNEGTIKIQEPQKKKFGGLQKAIDVLVKRYLNGSKKWKK